MVRRSPGPLLALSASLVLALALGACRHRQDPYTEVPRLDAHRLRNLADMASRAMSCPAAVLTQTCLDERVFSVSGCGQVREYALMGRGRGRYRGARWRPVVPVRERASTELGCPVAHLEVRVTTARTRDLRGCGHLARFSLICNQVDCAWVLAERRADPASAPIVVAAPAQPVATAAVPDAAVAALDASVRQALEAHRAAVLACAPGATVVGLRVSVASNGGVRVALTPPLSGTPAEPCVAAIFGEIRVPAGLGTELIHAIE